MFCVTFLLALRGSSAQALGGLQDATDLLLRAKEGVIDTVKRLPKYVCTETIDRYQYEPQTGPAVPAFNPHRSACDDIVAELRRKRGRAASVVC